MGDKTAHQDRIDRVLRHRGVVGVGEVRNERADAGTVGFGGGLPGIAGRQFGFRDRCITAW
jgi:hypothetical protein